MGRINATADEVPWSCCRIDLGRKCRNHNLKKQEARIGQQHLTIYTRGCAGVIEYVKLDICANIGLSLFLSVLMSVASIPCIRLFTTSKMRAVQFGGRVADSAHGWIFWETLPK